MTEVISATIGGLRGPGGTNGVDGTLAAATHSDLDAGTSVAKSATPEGLAYLGLTTLPFLSKLLVIKALGSTPTAARIKQTAANAISIAGLSLIAKDRGGNTLATLPATTNSYTFDEDQTWWWDVAANALTVSGNNAPPSSSSVPLLSFRGGIFHTGVLTAKLQEDRRYFKPQTVKCIKYTAADNRKVKTAVRIVNNKVIFDSAELYAINADGLNCDSYLGPDPTSTARFTATFIMADAQVLLWDRALNTFTVQDENAARTWRSVVLLHYIRGAFRGGFLLPYVAPFSNAVPVTAERRCQVIPGIPAGQDMTQVGNQVWYLAASTSAHASAFLHVYDADTLALLYSGTQNISHAGIVDYCAKSQTLMICNSGDGEGDAAAGPRIDLMTGIVPVTAAPALDWNTSPRVSIPFFDTSVTPAKALNDSFPAGTNAVFIDATTIWLNIGSQWRLALLGTGTQDFSDQTSGKTDLTRWGTYTAAAAGAYNGTALIVDGPFGGLYAGYTGQGSAYYEGKIVTAISRQGTTEFVEAVQFSIDDDGGYFMQAAWRHPTYTAAGAVLDVETEGVCVLNGRYLLLGGGGNFYRFPLPGKDMGGGGVVPAGGVALVTLPFAVNATPKAIVVSSTGAALSWVVDSGASTITITGAVGATFNWSCPIS